MYNITNFINYLIKKNNYKSYFEFGMDNPVFNYIFINCENKESQDFYPRFWTTDGYPIYIKDKENLVTKNLTYHMDPKDFYDKVLNKKFDIILIRKSNDETTPYLINKAIFMLNPGGTILIDNIDDSMYPFLAELKCLGIPLYVYNYDGKNHAYIKYTPELEQYNEIVTCSQSYGTIFKSDENINYFLNKIDYSDLFEQIDNN